MSDETQEFFQTDEAPADETPTQDAIPAPGEELDAPDEPQDERHWQSQYDKLKAKYEGVQTKIEKVEKYEPLFQYLDDPEVLSAIERNLTGGQTAVNPAASGHSQNGTSQDSPTWEEVLNSDPPEPPEMPSDPDDYEADRAFKQKQAEYMKELRDREVARTQRDRLLAEQQRQREEQARQLQQATHFMQREFGASPDEARGFISAMRNEDTGKRLYKQLFELYKQTGAKPEKPKVDEDRLNRLKNGRPTPGATVPGSAEPAEEESFFKFL